MERLKELGRKHGVDMEEVSKRMSPNQFPLQDDDDDEYDGEAKPGKMVHKKPDKHLKKLPGLSTNPKQPPFRLVLAKSDLLPDLLVCPMENFKGVVFFDSETLEPRSKQVKNILIKRTSSSVT
jgi:hypothetical protein